MQFFPYENNNHIFYDYSEINQKDKNEQSNITNDQC
jgi:hypothetical protein